jgi:isopenicillin N synthase-like dioxygenase
VLHLPKQTEIEDANDIIFARELVRTCHEIGFFYLTNHGVETDSVMDAAKEFFDLPLEAKLEVDYARSAQFRGYMRDGCENTGGRADRREQMEFGVESIERENARDGELYERLIGPNQWPTLGAPRLRAEVEKFQYEMDVLCRRIMRYLAIGMGIEGIEEEHMHFEDMFEDSPNMQMKICRYPPTLPCAKEFGVGEHTDSGILSLLVQDDVGGLQVKVHKTGEWIDAPPVSGALVVNLGEMVQLFTRGYLLATPHRVRNVDASKSRYSVPFFFNPKLEYRVKPIDPSLLERLSWSRPRPIEVAATSSHNGKNKLMDSYGANAFKSLARSHPIVMKRHHDDLIVQNDGTLIRK